MTNKTKELAAAGHALAKDLHCPESAALVRELATQLDVQRVRADVLAKKSVSVAEALPSPSETVLLFDANGEGWLIGWRSVWYGMGQVETGEWQWTFQCGDIEYANITHWAEMPEDPEAA